MRKRSTWRCMIGAAIAFTSFLSTSPVSAATNHYFYDPLGRLIGNTAENEQIKSYKYDAADNRSYLQMTVPSAPASNSMRANQYLFRDQALWSGDGRYELTLQEDSNLVLYGPTGALWSVGYLSGAAFLTMQGDGNLVLYDSQWNAVWASGTSGAPGAWFAIQTDGNLVVYSAANVALWNSGT